jgi:hypothetical protein
MTHNGRRQRQLRERHGGSLRRRGRGGKLCDLDAGAEVGEETAEDAGGLFNDDGLDRCLGALGNAGGVSGLGKSIS